MTAHGAEIILASQKNSGLVLGYTNRNWKPNMMDIVNVNWTKELHMSFIIWFFLEYCNVGALNACLLFMFDYVTAQKVSKNLFKSRNGKNYLTSFFTDTFDVIISVIKMVKHYLSNQKLSFRDSLPVDKSIKHLRYFESSLWLANCMGVSSSAYSKPYEHHCCIFIEKLWIVYAS